MRECLTRVQSGLKECEEVFEQKRFDFVVLLLGLQNQY
jgi:hypothetical protein